MLFALLISGIGTLVVIYAGGYLKGDRRLGRFYLILFGFMAAMLGIALADNVLLLYVFWALTGLTSYLLIGFDSHSPTRGGRAPGAADHLRRRAGLLGRASSCWPRRAAATSSRCWSSAATGSWPTRSSCR
jgi:NADH:ubiquinone oxidoreductase subunit 5 (subunit L)/multisubunit Na+/H+ antiporter MnhA subunit